MAKTTKVRIIFVEGDTELSFFNKMKQEKKISAKVIVKRNLWQDNIKSYAVTIPKSSELFVIFDCDQISQSERFLQNIALLKSRGHTIFLLQQTNNFEEELAYCCSMPLKRFIENFCSRKGSGVNDFKRDFISCSNPLQKLMQIGMQESKWFSRDLHVVLTNLRSQKSHFSKHFTLS